MEHVGKTELIAFAAGELADGPRKAVEAHLEGCEACQAVCDKMTDVRGLLGAWSVESVGRDLWPAIERCVGSPRPMVARPHWRTAMRMSRIAAAVVLGVGVGHAAGRLTWSDGPVHEVAITEASEEQAAEEFGLYVLASPSPAGLFPTISELTDASGVGEVTP